MPIMAKTAEYGIWRAFLVEPNMVELGIIVKIMQLRGIDLGSIGLLSQNLSLNQTLVRCPHFNCRGVRGGKLGRLGDPMHMGSIGRVDGTSDDLKGRFAYIYITYLDFSYRHTTPKVVQEFLVS